MFRIVIISLILNGFISIAQAQIHVEPHHSSTSEESLFRGIGAWFRDYGKWLESKGHYEDLRENARRKYIDNWYHAITVWWNIRDNYREKNKTTQWHMSRMAQLDLIEARALVKKREQEMRRSGLLPEKKSYFTHDGVQYDSYAAFKASTAYQQMLVERDERQRQRELEKLREEFRRRQAIDFFSKYNRLSAAEKLLYNERRKRERDLERIMNETPVND
jgi:hypothetical protein